MHTEIQNSEYKGRIIEMRGDGVNGIFICIGHYLFKDQPFSEPLEAISIVNESGVKEVFITETESQMVDIEYIQNKNKIISDNLIGITIIGC